MLTRRWTPLRYHPEQRRYWESESRFQVVPAGRRSGKTEITKRKLVKRSLKAPPGSRFFAAAPTREQAKRLYWRDLKDMIPGGLITDTLETELVIKLVHDVEIVVVGLDVPERIEGTPWDGCVIDEVANVKEKAWKAHIRPALSDREGWAIFIGVPEGRNHFYKLYRRGRSEDYPEWESFHWVSADILPEREIASAREDLDEDMFAQEFEASFVTFRGRAYRQFSEQVHSIPGLSRMYRPDRPLVVMFDFNVEPGAAVVAQEMRLPSGEVGTGAIGEVYIPYDSDTTLVCDRICHDWSGHSGAVHVYGDPTGGQRKSSGVRGTDWDLVRDGLRGTFSTVRFKVPKASPPEKDRLNAMRARLMSKSGRSRFALDPDRCPRLQNDLEGVRLVEGGTGQIDKKSDGELTHWTDALGYYVHERFPIRGRRSKGRVRATLG